MNTDNSLAKIWQRKEGIWLFLQDQTIGSHATPRKEETVPIAQTQTLNVTIVTARAITNWIVGTQEVERKDKHPSVMHTAIEEAELRRSNPQALYQLHHPKIILHLLLQQ